MNSRKKLNSLVTLAALACLLAGCRKAHNTPINQEMLKYLAYNAGSYWVYEDSATGRIDSFIYGGGSTTFKYNTGDDYSTYDRYMGAMFWYDVTDDTLVSVSSWELKDNHLSWNDYKSFRYDCLIYWPVVDGAVFSAGELKVSVWGSAKLSIPSQTDINCFRIHQACPIYDVNGNASLREEDFYYNRNVGMVRMVRKIKDRNFTWNLLRYKIM